MVADSNHTLAVGTLSNPFQKQVSGLVEKLNKNDSTAGCILLVVKEIL